jgi:hypothetical protein
MISNEKGCQLQSYILSEYYNFGLGHIHPMYYEKF